MLNLWKKAKTYNEVESLSFALDKAVVEYKDALSDDDKSIVDGLIVELNDAKKTEDTETMKSVLESVNAKWGEITQKIYAQPTQENTTSDSGDNTVDTDFEEVN